MGFNLCYDIAMEPTIFYSWQSDDSKTRSFVEKALKKAVQNIADNPEVELAPRVDKDTQGTAGAIHIVDTIKKKIEACGIFLADVSLIDTAKSGRSLVNQNVMFELGFAIGKHSESRVIMVANTDLGDIKNLPFDISHHRVIKFSPKDDSKGMNLQTALEAAINIHLNALDAEKKQHESETAKDKLIYAIENNKPTRTIANKYFEGVYAQYLNLSPDRYRGGNIQHYGAAVYDAYEKTKPITVELFEVLERAAEYKNGEVLLHAYKSLELVSRYYDIVPEDNGHMYDTSQEYPVLIVNEVVSLILGCITKEKLWDVMKDINETKLKRSESFQDTRSLGRLFKHPNNMYDHYNRMKNMQYTIPMTQILEERFNDQKHLLQTYIDGNLLRYFMLNTYPWAIGFVMLSSWTQYFPEFITEFKKLSFCKSLMTITKESTLGEFKDNIWKQTNIDFAGLGHFHNDNLVPVFERADIKSQDDIASEN